MRELLDQADEAPTWEEEEEEEEEEQLAAAPLSSDEKVARLKELASELLEVWHS